MINRYLIAAAISIAIVVAFYAIKFYSIFGFHLSSDPAVWGQLGDYIGGLLNPTLSFDSIILLIKSVSLQNEANTDLRNELKNSEKTERFRSFNSLFFNMIDSQKTLLRDLKIDFEIDGEIESEHGALAVMRIEVEIERLRMAGAGANEITSYVENLDSEDKIFGIMRAFYISLKIIFEKLSHKNGFEDFERREQVLTLVNFTDFTQLRLVLIGAQFLNYKSSKFLRENPEFNAALEEVNLEVGMY